MKALSKRNSSASFNSACHFYIFDNQRTSGWSVSQNRRIIASIEGQSSFFALSLFLSLSRKTTYRRSRLTVRYERAPSHFISFESLWREQRRSGVQGDFLVRGNHSENGRQITNGISSSTGLKLVMVLSCSKKRDPPPFSRKKKNEF